MFRWFFVDVKDSFFCKLIIFVLYLVFWTSMFLFLSLLPIFIISLGNVYSQSIETVTSRVLPEGLSILKSSSLPDNSNLYATIANGYVGMQVLSDTMYISGVYNGGAARENKSVLSHRARIPSTNSFTASLPSYANESLLSMLYSLDVNYGEF